MNRIAAAALAFVLLMTVGTFSMDAAAADSEPDDAWIVISTKMAMWTTDGVPSTGVDVDSLDGRVVLHGNAETTAEREAAERVARTVSGVQQVRNLLRVVPTRKNHAVQDPDENITVRVKKAFAAERGLAGRGIEVASVNQGVVL